MWAHSWIMHVFICCMMAVKLWPKEWKHPLQSGIHSDMIYWCLMWKKKASTKPQRTPLGWSGTACQAAYHTSHWCSHILFRTWKKSIKPFLCNHNSLQSSWKAFHWMLEHGCRDLWSFRASVRYGMPLMGKRWLAVSVPTDPVAVQIELKNNKSCVYSTSLSVMWLHCLNRLADWA